MLTPLVLIDWFCEVPCDVCGSIMYVCGSIMCAYNVSINILNGEFITTIFFLSEIIKREDRDSNEEAERKRKK